jgi:CRISPR type III-B/RAMP module RAMP protein Cmr1
MPHAELLFRCKIISPTFNYGTNQNKPELREESVLHGLHDCYRMLGFHHSVNDIHHSELQLFGSQDQRGKVNLLVFNHNNNSHTPIHRAFNANDFEPAPGKIYTDRRTNITRPMQKKALVPNQQFGCFMSSRHEPKLSYIADLFRFWSFLGGLGGRTRRGMGAFQIIQENDRVTTLPTNAEEIQTQIAALLNNLCGDGHWHTSIEDTHYLISRIGVTPNELPAIQSITIGEVYPKLISGTNLGKDRNAELLTKISRANSQLKVNWNYAKSMGGDVNGEKYPSPMMTSVVQLGANYCPIITELSLPNDELFNSPTQADIRSNYKGFVLNTKNQLNP